MSLKPFVKKSGQGPALVLLHGWGLHGGIWDSVLPELEQYFTVFNIDLPGFGYSPVHNGEYSLDYLVDSVAEVLPEKCFMVGWSIGGMVATKLAIRFPEKIEKLVTVASNPCFVEQGDWKGMKVDILESFISYLEEDYEGTLIRFLGIQTMGSATQKADIKLLKEKVFIHGQPSKKALRGGLQILRNESLLAELDQIQVPMLRLYGRLDALVPTKVNAAVSEILPQSISKVYRKSAHAPFLSHSAEFVNDLTEFLLADSQSSKES